MSHPSCLFLLFYHSFGSCFVVVCSPANPPNTQVLLKLKECNHTLETVKKSLELYLDSKRKAFARFYFLSNEDLLAILSQTKDPTAVQPHLKKCFENVVKLDFQADTTITGMFSDGGERVEFVNVVDPRSRNVEDWLLNCEEMMRASVMKVLNDSIIDYPKKPRAQWILQWHGQCVLTGCLLQFTAQVEQYLQKGLAGLVEYYEIQKQQLNDMVAVVRQPITKIQQDILNALIVLDVHNRDILERLIADKVGFAIVFLFQCSASS